MPYGLAVLRSEKFTIYPSMMKDLRITTQGDVVFGAPFWATGCATGALDISESRLICPFSNFETSIRPFSVESVPISTLDASRSRERSLTLRRGIFRKSSLSFFMATARSLTFVSPVRSSIGARSSLYWRYASFIATSSFPDGTFTLSCSGA